MRSLSVPYLRSPRRRSAARRPPRVIPPEGGGGEVGGGRGRAACAQCSLAPPLERRQTGREVDELRWKLGLGAEARHPSHPEGDAQVVDERGAVRLVQKESVD